MGDHEEVQKNISAEKKTEKISDEKPLNTAFQPDLQNIKDKAPVLKNRKEVPADKIHVLPEADKVEKLSPGKLAARRKHYDNKTYESYKEELKNAGINIPDDIQNSEPLVQIRNDLHYKVEWEENGKKMVEYYWKDGVREEVKEKLNWLIEYQKIHDDSIVAYKGEVLEAELPIHKEYNVSLKEPEKTYEYQGNGTNNCFCCAGAAMINQYLKRKGKEGNYTQKNLRAFRSDIKKYDPKGSRFATEDDYKRMVGEVDSYAGEGKTAVGNIFQIGDFFLKELARHDENAILNKMNINLPPLNSTDSQRDDRKSHNIKAVFMNKVNEVLGTGNVVTFLETYGASGHYYTITGIKGETIEYLDSLGEDKKSRKKISTVDDMLARINNKGRAIELAWLSDMKSPEELQEEFLNLRYDVNTGYSVQRMTPENMQNPMHTQGIEVMKEMGDSGALPDGVSLVSYIRNPLKKLETESIEKSLRKASVKTGETKEKPKTEEPKETKENRRDKERRKALEEFKEIKTNAEEVTLKQRTLTKQQKAALKAEEKKQKKLIFEYEKKSKDYETFGVGFHLDKSEVTAADSEYMRNVKLALRNYLEIRNRLFEEHNIADIGAAERNKRKNEGEDYVHKKRGNQDDIFIEDEPQQDLYEFDTFERETLGKAYDLLQRTIQSYKDENNRPFKFGRGAARLKQIRLIEERIHIDNNRFFLSSTKRALIDSVDHKYSKDDSYGNLRKMLMPTWLKAVKIGAEISLRNQAYREERRRQRREGTLPNVFMRMLQWSGTGIKNNMFRTLQAYEAIGGLVDRGLGLGTMLAANSLEIAGKVVKAPIKLLSACFNGISKHIFGSKKRWKVDYNVTEGWKSLDDGRKIFRRYLKGACIIPAAVVETLTRGVPAIFGHHFKSGVYKRTGRWTSDIIKDIKNAGEYIGIKDYGIADRADKDFEMAGGYRTVEKDGEKKWEYVEGNQFDDKEDDEYEESKEELKNADSDMQAVQDKAFIPVQMPAERKGFWSRLKSGALYAVKESTLFSVRLGLKALSLVSKDTESETSDNKDSNIQQNRQHNKAPGIRGEDFEDEDPESDEVFSDVRRGPLIWEKLTAGDPEDPPEICILAKENTRGSSKALSSNPKGDIGHAMIGLYYSRYNKATKRKERYKLRIGFYPGTVADKMDIAMLGGAFTYGKLKNDDTHTYDVGRRYKITNKDVNRILRASEEYADKGYNYFKRNCTTFAAEMGKLSGIPSADDFKPGEMKFGLLSGLIVNAGSGMAPAFQSSAYNRLKKEAGKDDLNYQNFGQKIVTKEDIDRYNKTKDDREGIGYGYVPGALGETVRNSNKGGELTAYYEEDKELNENLEAFSEKVNRVGDRLFSWISRDDKLTEPDFELRKLIKNRGSFGLNSLNENPGDNEKKITDQIKAIHADIRKVMKALNDYAVKNSHLFGGDREFHALMMDYLSLCEVGLSAADELYEKKIVTAAATDVAKSQIDYFDKGVKVIEYLKDGSSHPLTAPLSYFEGFILMGRTVKDALEVNRRKDDLRAVEKKSKEQMSELGKLERTIDLAFDLGTSNRYVFNKKSFSDQDIRYAFVELPKLEISTDVRMPVNPSTVHQNTILENVFGGIKDLNIPIMAENKYDNGTTETVIDYANTCETIAAHMMEGIQKHPDVMRKILASCVECDAAKSVDNLVYEFIVIKMSDYFESAFAGSRMEGKEMSTAENLSKNTKLADYLRKTFTELKGGK